MSKISTKYGIEDVNIVSP